MIELEEIKNITDEFVKKADDFIESQKEQELLHCPFCQQELEKRHAATTDYNSMFITYYCGNPECESTTDLTGCKEFWDILGQLIRTRKALDVAKNALYLIDETYQTCQELEADIWAAVQLTEEKISALEQKDANDKLMETYTA